MKRDYIDPKLKPYTIHDLPRSERPRERLLELGSDKLSSAELIAIILNTGIKGESVMMIAQKLIMQFGSLKEIMNASIEDLKHVKGLGEVKAVKLSACFGIAKKIIWEEEIYKRNISERKNKTVNSPTDLFAIIKTMVTNFSREHFFVVSLDARNCFIGIDSVSVGTLTASLVHPRETFESAIRRHAAQIIVAHNHPSGNLEPSEDDLKITKRLVDAGKIMGIEVIDHLIITEEGFLSFKEKNLI